MCYYCTQVNELDNGYRTLKPNLPTWKHVVQLFQQLTLLDISILMPNTGSVIMPSGVI